MSGQTLNLANILAAQLLEREEGWIAVDLDGTLAKHTDWKGATHIGEPVPEMARRVRRWVGRGRKVKIFTARADDERSVNAIKKWLKANDLPDLEVTNLKDKDCLEIWDDRAVGVKKNTGKRIGEAETPKGILRAAKRQAPSDDGRLRLIIVGPNPNDPSDPICKCPLCGHQDTLMSGFSYLSAGFNGVEAGAPDDCNLQECGGCGARLLWDHIPEIVEAESPKHFLKALSSAPSVQVTLRRVDNQKPNTVWAVPLVWKETRVPKWGLTKLNRQLHDSIQLSYRPEGMDAALQSDIEFQLNFRWRELNVIPRYLRRGNPEYELIVRNLGSLPAPKETNL